MTIYEVKKQIAGLTKEQRIEKATSYLVDFIDCCDEATSQFGLSVDFRDIVSLTLCAAIISDGELDRSEYNVYTKLCDAINAEAKSYVQCQGFSENSSEFVSLFEELSESMSGAFIAEHQRENYDKFIVALACLLSDDGEIEGDELRLLSFFVEEDSSSYIGSSSLSSSRTKDVELVTYGANMTRNDDRYYFTIGAELKNPNIEHCARNVSVKVMVKDASGRILETNEDIIDYIDSNATFYYGNEFSVDRGRPENYTVQVNCDDFVKSPANSTFADGITCSHYNVDTTRWGDTEFTGNVHNGYDRKLWVRLYFAFYNASGEITGGAFTSSSLYGNSDDGFDVLLSTNIDRDKVRCSPTFDFMNLMD